MDWNFNCFFYEIEFDRVAPHVGAWIEIQSYLIYFNLPKLLLMKEHIYFHMDLILKFMQYNQPVIVTALKSVGSGKSHGFIMQ